MIPTVIITSLRRVSHAKALRGSYLSSVKNVAGDCDRAILLGRSIRVSLDRHVSLLLEPLWNKKVIKKICSR